MEQHHDAGACWCPEFSSAGSFSSASNSFCLPRPSSALRFPSFPRPHESLSPFRAPSALQHFKEAVVRESHCLYPGTELREESFKNCPYPTFKNHMTLVRRVNVKEIRVQNWFMNCHVTSCKNSQQQPDICVQEREVISAAPVSASNGTPSQSVLQMQLDLQLQLKLQWQLQMQPQVPESLPRMLSQAPWCSKLLHWSVYPH